MMTLEQAIIAYSLDRADIESWIDQEWLRPLKAGDVWTLDDSDVARLQLICDLRRDLALDDDAMPVVLSLLDQLYAARNTLRHVRDAIAQLPGPELDDILARIDTELTKR